jgi:hypothetical protein
MNSQGYRNVNHSAVILTLPTCTQQTQATGVSSFCEVQDQLPLMMPLIPVVRVTVPAPASLCTSNSCLWPVQIRVIPADDSTCVDLPWCPGHQLTVCEFHTSPGTQAWDCCPRYVLTLALKAIPGSSCMTAACHLISSWLASVTGCDEQLYLYQAIACDSRAWLLWCPHTRLAGSSDFLMCSRMTQVCAPCTREVHESPPPPAVHSAQECPQASSQGAEGPSWAHTACRV